jgi:gluconolactonase
MALDDEGGLAVAHIGTGVWRFDPLGRPTHWIAAEGRAITNVAYGGPDRRSLFIVDSSRGCILRAEMPVSGRVPYAHR